MNLTMFNFKGGKTTTPNFMFNIAKSKIAKYHENERIMLELNRTQILCSNQIMARTTSPQEHLTVYVIIF